MVYPTLSLCGKLFDLYIYIHVVYTEVLGVFDFFIRFMVCATLEGIAQTLELFDLCIYTWCDVYTDVLVIESCAFTT